MIKVKYWFERYIKICHIIYKKNERLKRTNIQNDMYIYIQWKRCPNYSNPKHSKQNWEHVVQLMQKLLNQINNM